MEITPLNLSVHTAQIIFCDSGDREQWKISGRVKWCEYQTGIFEKDPASIEIKFAGAEKTVFINFKDQATARIAWRRLHNNEVVRIFNAGSADVALWRLTKFSDDVVFNGEK